VIAHTIKMIKSRLSLPHEVIISDGKSKDKTIEISRANADITVEYTGLKRQTIAEGRNDGAKVAHGDFLVYIDSDCYLPDINIFFNTALEHFKDENVVALTVAIKVLPEFETFADKVVFSSLNQYFRLVNNVFGVGISAGEFQMIRRSAFDKVGGYNPNLIASEDVDLFYRLGKIGKIVFDPHLTIMHTGRRAHKIGWPKLLSQWIANTISMSVFGRAHSKEWKVIR
jgi:glycosyltransferase involved in cell wall biosynthesis